MDVFIECQANLGWGAVQPSPAHEEQVGRDLPREGETPEWRPEIKTEPEDPSRKDVLLIKT